ncbi:MAG: hypothetical protein M1812_002739, partial [Candelaria pacifica]
SGPPILLAYSRLSVDIPTTAEFKAVGTIFKVKRRGWATNGCGSWGIVRPAEGIGTVAVATDEGGAAEHRH